MTDAEQREAARQFVNRWMGKGKEDEDGRSYWIDLLTNVLGMDNVTERLNFEKKVVIDGNTKRIDVYIPETRVIIEQKSLGKALDQKIRNSGDVDLTPFEQADRYNGSVSILWKPLFESGVHIDFAYRTFIWDSEASIKAHVHCVIVGFSRAVNNKQKIIYSGENAIPANNINGYLLDAENIFIEKRMKPLCNVPEIALGGQAIDGGFLILTEEEKEEFLEKEPQASPFFRHYMMGKDFIDRKPRYCIWLVGADPGLLKKCPMILERVNKVREFRLSSTRANTKKAAENPTLFASILEHKNQYIAIPKVSSQNRRYIPMDYLDGEIIPGDKLFTMPNASFYEFGVLMSNVHMAWMRAVCGRLKSDYSYSNTIVYNNFPWPVVTEKTREQIEKSAQEILKARTLYPSSNLAALYDPLTMPAELRRAHTANDKAVMAAYGFSTKMTEADCVGELMKLYQKMQ